MHRTATTFLLLGCINALLGVGLGAFGAHGVKSWMAPDLFPVYQTAVEYQFYHAFGLLGVGLLLYQFPTQTLIARAGWFMFAGIVLFSGSLYILSLTSIRWLGAITPIGGTAFIVAWLLLIVSIIRQRRIVS